jgi:FG-GAP-like repeat
MASKHCRVSHLTCLMLVASPALCASDLLGSKPQEAEGASIRGQSNPAPQSASARARALRPSFEDSANGCAAQFATAPTPIASLSGNPADVVVADVDRDGTLDIVVATGNDTGQGNVSVLFGPFDGGPPSATWTSDAGDYYRRLAIGDVDGDGDLDIAVAIQPPSSDSTKHKRASKPVSSKPVNPFYSELLDCDGGVQDDSGTPGTNAPIVPFDGGSTPPVVAVFQSTGASSRDFGQAPSQRFTYKPSLKDCPLLKGAPLGALSVDFGDFNGDGFLDLAVGGASRDADCSVPVEVLPNDGHGHLLSSSAAGGWLANDQIMAYSVRFLDWDGDGLVDLLATTEYGTQWAFLYMGVEGGGTPSLSRTSVDAGFHYALSCALVVASDAVSGAATGETVVVGALNAKESAALYAVPTAAALVRRGDSQVPIAQTPLPAGVRLADFDRDGQLDAVMPLWTFSDAGAEGVAAGPVVCADRIAAGNAAVPVSTSLVASQGVAVGDLRGAARLAASATPPACVGGPARYVATIAEPNVDDVRGATRNGVAMAAGQFAAPPGAHLVYVKDGFACSAPPTIQYVYSTAPDIVVTNTTSCPSCSTTVETFSHTTQP